MAELSFRDRAKSISQAQADIAETQDAISFQVEASRRLVNDSLALIREVGKVLQRERRLWGMKE